MPNDYLDFEEPISALENKIQELQSSDQTQGEDLRREISKLNESIIKLTEQIYKNLNIWQCVQVARHPQRPHFIDLVDKICEDFDELHGDRHYGDD